MRGGSVKLLTEPAELIPNNIKGNNAMAAAQLSSSLEDSTSIINVQGYTKTCDTGLSVDSTQQEVEGESTDLSIVSRHLLTIACLIGTDAKLELEWHIRKALRDGCPVSEIKQTFSFLAIYCDTPAAVAALANAQQIVDMWVGMPKAG